MGRRFLVLLGLALVAGCWSGVAHAGFVVSPPSGTTTSSRPTFTAYLEPQEQLLARIWIASDTEMDSSYFPTHNVGSCIPSTPTGTQYTFSCQPSYYSNASYGAGLPPGTYYWWLTFYHTDPGSFFSTLHISGPLVFSVPAPTPPTNASLVSPYDGAVVGTSPTLTIQAPAGAAMHIYASLLSDRLNDGSPAGGSAFSCSGTASADSTYTCKPSSVYDLTPGTTYFWWAVLGVGDTNWIYGPRRFTVQVSSGGGGGGGGGSGGGSGGAAASSTSHSLADAPNLPRAVRWTGASVKETRLSTAAYALTKFIGTPKSIAVACWSTADWQAVSEDVGYNDAGYSLLGFYTVLMPHWVQLSPEVCRATETLIHHRPAYPNRFTANAVEALTHEMMHALGITSARYGSEAEPLAECYGMQLSIVLAVNLGVPYRYADGLAKYNLLNYATRPPSYRDTSNCREDGAWDLFKGRSSPPWHSYSP